MGLTTMTHFALKGVDMTKAKITALILKFSVLAVVHIVFPIH